MPHEYSLRSKMSSQKDNPADEVISPVDSDATETSNNVFGKRDKLCHSPTRTDKNDDKTPPFKDYLSKDKGVTEHTMHEMNILRGELSAQRTEISRLSEQLKNLMVLLEDNATKKSNYDFPRKPSEKIVEPPRDTFAKTTNMGAKPKDKNSMQTGGDANDGATASGGLIPGVGTQTGGAETIATGQSNNFNVRDPSIQLSLPRVDNREISFAFTKWNPEWWFQNLESQMLYKNVTDDQARYWVVMNNLGDEIRVIGDALRGVENGRKYESLKEIVLRKFTKTRQQKLHELFSELRADGKKPSELFFHMDQLAQGEIKEGAIYTWWLGKLPFNVQAILPAMYDKDKNLATLNEADRLYDLLRRQDPVFEVSADSNNENVLIARLEAIEKSLKDRKERQKTRGRSKSRTRDGSSESGYCYYHEKFKKKAYRCKGNCAWKGQLAERPKTQNNNDKKKSKDISGDEKN